VLLDITAAEGRLIASLLEVKRARAKSSEDLLLIWEEVVRRIEQGYRLTLYDYTNDLGARDLLNYLSRSVSSELSRRMEAAFESTDNRFRAATVEFARGVLPRAATSDRWWYFRKPRIMVGELREDFLELESHSD
jgi:hypothetical protein